MDKHYIFKENSLPPIPGGPSDKVLDILDPGLDAGGKPECPRKTFGRKFGLQTRYL